MCGAALSFTELGKELGKQWNALNEKARAVRRLARCTSPPLFPQPPPPNTPRRLCLLCHRPCVALQDCARARMSRGGPVSSRLGGVVVSLVCPLQPYQAQADADKARYVKATGK